MHNSRKLFQCPEADLTNIHLTDITVKDTVKIMIYSTNILLVSSASI